MKSMIALFLSLFSLLAMADYQLAKTGKVVTCYAEDNQSFILNAKRTTLKYVVEGESTGPKRIVEQSTDKRTYIAYKTSEGTLILSDSGDSYQFAEDAEAFEVKCR